MSLEQAVECLQHGGIIIYPTETFFGIGCKACDADAVARVFLAKRRKFNLPLPIIAANRAQVEKVAFWDARLDTLARQFWPGPLTVLLAARDCVPGMLTGGTGRVAVRVSSHVGACRLAEQAGEALVASSANISGQPPVTTLDGLDPALLAATDGLLGLGEQPQGGLPSTLVEFTPQGPLRLLRNGAVPSDALAAAGFSVVAS